MIGAYILNGHEPVPEPDAIKWARWYETADRHVGLTVQGDARISTVFLSIDHGWAGQLELFETMVFRAGAGAECERYATWAEAESGHARWVKYLFDMTWTPRPPGA